MASKRVNDPEIEISWRTPELGPDIRRALFKKANPSIMIAGAKDTPEARRESKTDERKASDRPRQRRSSDKSK